jgi:hypothetical protein
MGWFDKKSWQLRRKIRDLQSELAVAQREGKYVVEQGLFFAELQEMGDATMMVLGTADHLDSEEEEIIRNFFDRNGFTVETLRLDRTHKTLAAVELIPPEELTRRVARILKESGFRLIDDSEQERQSNVDKNTISLSSIIRAISVLFSTHVHQLIVSTQLKMNMEGNRLLHWTPLIRECLMKKVSADVVTLCRDPFVNAYNHYYGRFGEMADPEQFQRFTDEPSDEQSLVQEQLSAAEEPAEPEEGSKSDEKKDTAWAPPSPEPDDTGAATRNATRGLFSEGTPVTSSHGDRSVEAAHALANIYKGLIGASADRRVRNAEVLLDVIAQFFSAQSICILSRPDAHSPFKLQANSGKSQCLETTEEGVVRCDTEVLHKAVEAHCVTALAPGGNGNSHPEGLVIPIETDDATEAVMYIVKPQAYDGSVGSNDSNHLSSFVRVFREFPDLVLPGSFSHKS